MYDNLCVSEYAKPLKNQPVKYSTKQMLAHEESVASKDMQWQGGIERYECTTWHLPSEIKGALPSL